MSLAGLSFETAIRRTWWNVLLTCVREGCGGGVRTGLVPLLAALMRAVMPAMFSDSCFARCGLICISSAIVDAGLMFVCKTYDVHG